MKVEDNGVGGEERDEEEDKREFCWEKKRGKGREEKRRDKTRLKDKKKTDRKGKKRKDRRVVGRRVDKGRGKEGRMWIEEKRRKGEK